MYTEIYMQNWSEFVTAIAMFVKKLHFAPYILLMQPIQISSNIPECIFTAWDGQSPHGMIKPIFFLYWSQQGSK